MAVIFPKWTNKVPLVLAAGGPLALVAVVFGIWYWWSPKYTDVGYQPTQPVPFSHKLHAGDLGLDCRYCHHTVERSSYSAIPATETCMNCHTIVQGQNPHNLDKIRESHQTGEPVEWVRVHMLPDYAFFDHSVHIAAGVACQSCHGRIDQMEKVTQAEPLSMSWCLDCHRNPEPNLRPKDKVTQMGWAPEADAATPHAGLADIAERAVNPPINCSGCHR